MSAPIGAATFRERRARISGGALPTVRGVDRDSRSGERGSGDCVRKAPLRYRRGSDWARVLHHLWWAAGPSAPSSHLKSRAQEASALTNAADRLYTTITRKRMSKSKLDKSDA